MKIPKYKIFQRLEVRWDDSVIAGEWKCMEEALDPDKWEESKAWSIGYYLKHDKKFLYLASDHGVDIAHDCVPFIIPLGCIKKIQKI